VQYGAGALPFPSHFDGKRFFNPDATQARDFLDVLRWKLTSRPEPSPRYVSDVVPSTTPSTVGGNELHVTLINHSTLLLQQNGERASPFTSVGPRRRREPGVRWEDLPRIDFVLLSHNHYDHLDLATLQRLENRCLTAGLSFTACRRCIFRREDRSTAIGRFGAVI
jgi:hypothetical protein